MTGAGPPKIGLIVNPIAGMGGSVGLKGTDGEAILAQALALGAMPVAPARAVRALGRLIAAAGHMTVVTCPSAMGAAVVREAGIAPVLLGDTPTRPTKAAHTKAAAAEMRDFGVDLILFAGGDGTARDILAAIGNSLPMIGIPSGVKMHSAVFAVTPEAAGQLAALVAGGDANILRYRDAEVMDVDEDAVREGRLSARLHGYGRVPFERHLVQGMKVGGLSEDAACDALCWEVADEMAPGVTYLLGPGTMTQRILMHLGLAGTLLGVDAVRDRQLLGKDLRADEVEALTHGGAARIVVSVIGGQGYIFGRGNPQFSAAAIGAVGRDGLIVLASRRKLLSLNHARILVDTGDPDLDQMLRGYIRVRIGPRESTMLRIGA
jgi:predicted polyphosphate/ATP-dependent NAD kinase